MAYTYVDDTYVYNSPADGGAAQETPNAPPPLRTQDNSPAEGGATRETPNALPPLWTQDNTTACIDVSCAYRKARETSKR